MASRNDWWSADETHTLIEEWGKRFLSRNRLNLKHSDWQAIASHVNSAHGRTENTSRSEVQCKNRIDTVKKTFKAEKKTIEDSNGVSQSSWRFYSRMEFLMGSNSRNLIRNARPLSVAPPPGFPALPWYQESETMVPFESRKEAEVPLVIGKGKEPMETSCQRSDVPSGSGLKRTYSVMSDAAAAEEENEDAEEENEDGMKRLAKAIEGFGGVYERVETMKMNQMVELAKVRMKFAKDLELERMKMMVDMQVELEKGEG